MFVGSSSKSGAILYSENLAGLRIQIDGIKVEKIRNKQSSTLFELSYGALELKNSSLTYYTGNLFRFIEMLVSVGQKWRESRKRIWKRLFFEAF